MNTVVIRPSRLRGAVTPPSSKSQLHRCLIAAALAPGESVIGPLELSEDMLATLGGIEALGALWVRMKDGAVRVAGLGSLQPPQGLPRIDCGESGSTLRFLIPVALALAGGGFFTGRGRLMERPMEPYRRLFEEKGITMVHSGDGLTVRGRLEASEYRLTGDVSSQFITGLLFALPLLKGDSRIVLTTPLESKSYVDMTLEVLERFGVQVQWEGDTFLIPGSQCYRSRDLTAEADWSQAAFWYAANFLDSQVDIQGLNPKSAQGDLQVASCYWKLARPGDTELDVSQCPDLAPPLAAMAAVRRGTARLVGAARLRMKESDRLKTVSDTLNALGGQVEEHPDSLTIRGLEGLEGGVTIDCRGDHRIAMMAAVAATACRRPVTLRGADCVKKSYPNFWEHYRGLGGDFDVLTSG